MRPQIDPFRNIHVLVIALVIAASAMTVSADAVSDWNAIAYQTVGASVPARPGPSGTVDVAVVQLAVYDAVQAIEGDYQPYHVHVAGATGSTTAAVARAAHDILVNRFPAQAAALDAIYIQYLLDRQIPANDPGVAVGAAAAAGIITLRANDGSFPNPPLPPFIGGTGVGEWRPTPPANAPFAAEWLATMTPFVMRKVDQFRIGPMPRLTSPEYTRAYNEVKDYGAATGSLRSAAQTDLANFWNTNFALLINRVGRDLSVNHSVSETSRLFALVAVSMADSAIASWDCKRLFMLWRPITAIRLGDTDGNPKTDADPAWGPQIVNTPPYAEYTSGANALSASGSRALSLFFGANEAEFTIMTTNTGPTTLDTRSYTKFSQIRDEVEDARILQGIHFRFGDADGRRQGEHIAQWANAHFFRPVDEPVILIEPVDAGLEQFVKP